MKKIAITSALFLLTSCAGFFEPMQAAENRVAIKAEANRKEIVLVAVKACQHLKSTNDGTMESKYGRCVLSQTIARGYLDQ